MRSIRLPYTTYVCDQYKSLIYMYIDFACYNLLFGVFTNAQYCNIGLIVNFKFRAESEWLRRLEAALCAVH